MVAIKVNSPRLRSVWLNWHLGGFHWAHNDLTNVNLKAIHSCPVCREFREHHWPRKRMQEKPRRSGVFC
jgi:hypothetical protein